MSTAMRKSWVDLPQEEKDKRAEQSSVRWQNMDAQTKADILSKAAKKVRETSKNGSKLENYIVAKLQDNNYYVLQHVKHTFSSSELEMDMMLPAEKIVIEIDGPSHFLPLYGEEVLQKRQAADARKSGMIINEGWKIYVRRTFSIFSIEIRAVLRDSFGLFGCVFCTFCLAIRAVGCRTLLSQNVWHYSRLPPLFCPQELQDVACLSVHLGLFGFHGIAEGCFVVGRPSSHASSL